MSTEQWHQYKLDDWTVDPQANCLTRGEQVVQLEAKTMDVLAYLLTHADRVVSTEELLSAVWPDRVVEQSTVHRRINQIRTALDDDAKTPTFIKTIVRRGYQVVASVSVAESVAEPDSETDTPSHPAEEDRPSQVGTPTTTKPRWWAAGGMTLILAAASIWAYVNFVQKQPVPESFSLVFETGDSTDALASRLVVQDLTRALLEKSIVRVVANSATADPDFRLHVDTEANADTVRINLRLHSQLLDQVMWSQAYTKPLPVSSFPESSFAATRIVRSVLGVGATLLLPDSIGAEAKRLYARSLTVEQPMRAIQMLESALHLEPDFAIARGQMLFLMTPDQFRERGYEVARRLLRQAPVTLYNIAVAKCLLFVDLDYEEARRQIDIAATAKYTRSAIVDFWHGIVDFSDGRLSDALLHMQAAMAADANADQPYVYVLAGRIKNGLGSYAEAERFLKDRLGFFPAGAKAATGALSLQVELIKALALQNKTAEANQMLDTLWAEFGGTDGFRFPHLYALLGRDKEARALLSKLHTAREQGVPVPAYHIFEAWVHLGEQDAAVAVLSDLIEEHDIFNFGLVKRAGFLQEIRQHPGYNAAMQTLAAKEAAGNALMDTI